MANGTYTGDSEDDDLAFEPENPDQTPPTLSTSSPANGASSVAADAKITLTFDEYVLSSTINATHIIFPSAMTGTWSLSANVATFTPDSNWTASTAYTMRLGTGIKDYAGNAMVQKLVGFTIASVPTISIANASVTEGMAALRT